MYYKYIINILIYCSITINNNTKIQYIEENKIYRSSRFMFKFGRIMSKFLYVLFNVLDLSTVLKWENNTWFKCKIYIFISIILCHQTKDGYCWTSKEALQKDRYTMGFALQYCISTTYKTGNCSNKDFKSNTPWCNCRFNGPWFKYYNTFLIITDHL